MRCDDVPEVLAVPPEERTRDEAEAIAAHLASCPDCLDESEGQAAARSLASLLRTREDAPEGTFDAIREAVAAGTAEPGTCEWARPRLAVLDELDGEGARAVEAHLTSCPDCRAEADAQRAVAFRFRTLAEDRADDLPAPDELEADREAIRFWTADLDACRGVRTRIGLRATGDLPGAEVAAVERHLAACEECRAEAERADGRWEPLAALAEGEPPPGVLATIRRGVRAATRREPDRHLAFWVRAAAVAAALLVAFWVGTVDPGGSARPEPHDVGTRATEEPSTDRSDGDEAEADEAPAPTLEESRPVVRPDVHFSLEGWDVPEDEALDF